MRLLFCWERLSDSDLICLVSMFHSHVYPQKVTSVRCSRTSGIIQTNTTTPRGLSIRWGWLVYAQFGPTPDSNKKLYTFGRCRTGNAARPLNPRVWRKRKDWTDHQTDIISYACFVTVSNVNITDHLKGSSRPINESKDSYLVYLLYDAPVGETARSPVSLKVLRAASIAWWIAGAR